MKLTGLIILVCLSSARSEGETTESDLFEEWMKEVQQGMDKDFEEFMKNLETVTKEDSRQAHGISNSRSSRKEETREFMSQNTVDKGQELLQSVRQDLTSEFMAFMKSQQTRMESGMESFLTNMEKEMDSQFDEFYQAIMGEDSRSAYQEKYQFWKSSQLTQVYSEFQAFEGTS